MEFGFEPLCDQLRTSFEPASVMEFGLYFDDMFISDVTPAVKCYEWCGVVRRWLRSRAGRRLLGSSAEFLGSGLHRLSVSDEQQFLDVGRR